MIPVVASARVMQAVLANLRSRLRDPDLARNGHACYFCLPQGNSAVLRAQAGYYSWSCPVCAVNYVVTNSEIDRWEREQDAALAVALKRGLDRRGGPRRLLELTLEGGERVVVAPVDEAGPRVEEDGPLVHCRDTGCAGCSGDDDV